MVSQVPRRLSQRLRSNRFINFRISFDSKVRKTMTIWAAAVDQQVPRWAFARNSARPALHSPIINCTRWRSASAVTNTWAFRIAWSWPISWASATRKWRPGSRTDGELFSLNFFKFFFFCLFKFSWSIVRVLAREWVDPMPKKQWKTNNKLGCVTHQQGCMCWKPINSFASSHGCCDPTNDLDYLLFCAFQCDDSSRLLFVECIIAFEWSSPLCRRRAVVYKSMMELIAESHSMCCSVIRCARDSFGVSLPRRQSNRRPEILIRC